MTRRLSVYYIISDFVASAAAWAIFCLIRNRISGLDDPCGALFTWKYIGSAIVVSLSWVLIYAVTGFYSVSLKRSRLAELAYSVAVTVPGVFMQFFIILSKGFITDNSLYLYFLETLFILQFIIAYIPRLAITSSTARKVHRGVLGYSTIIIGSNGKALEIFRKIKQEKIPSGNILKGFVSIREQESGVLKEYLPMLGNLSDLSAIIEKHGIEEVILAIEGDEHETIGEVISCLEFSNITIKAIPSLKDYLTGRVEQSAIFGTPLLEISNRLMPVWQSTVKKTMDYGLSLFFLVLLSPFMALIAIMIKLTGKGPVIYSQERIGRYGRPFRMYKFRSMYDEAEKDSPLLSSRTDQRVTAFGRFMRKHRIDEIPNLINVLKGEMSLVGPRPERQFFINQIVTKAPHYTRLMKVRPGITSWGQVKYGYASDVDQMIERLEFDLLYLENMSLLIDLKIMIYTLLIIVKGKGV
jgi:exopolysaccharide biosynthesis polyprenyl glycosylphosphotransferase